MKTIFLGVGEAFDERHPNNAHLISSRTNLLLDCGYSVPQQLWRYNPDPSFLDAIYISHGHADHYFGIPPLLVRMWEEKRTKPLTFICPEGLKRVISGLIELGYKGISKRFQFVVDFIEVSEQQISEFNEFTLSFAKTLHPATNLAIRVTDGEHSICYSGDGMFTEKTEYLYKNADLVIHDAYSIDEAMGGHANITDLISMGERNRIKCLALTHLNRNVRKHELEKIKSEIAGRKIHIIIPEELTEYVFT